jgi:hypothetical protein
MNRVIPITPEEIRIPDGLPFTHDVKFNEDGSVSLYGNSETKFYADEVRSYFIPMVEGTFRQMGIPYKKLAQIIVCDKVTIFKPENPNLPTIEVFYDGEGTTMTGNLHETLYFDGRSVHYQNILASGERRKVVHDFRRFLTDHL